MRLALSEKALDKIPIIEAVGQIDMSNCHMLSDAISDQIGRGQAKIVIDFTQLSYIDSSCLGALLGGLERAKERGGNLSIVGNPLVDRVLTLTGLTRVFPFHSNLREAVEEIKRLGKERPG